MPNESPNQESEAIASSPCAPHVARCTSIEWFHEGFSRSVEVDGVKVTIRLVGRRGRRARIAIEAPAGAVFRAIDYIQSRDAAVR